MLLWEFLWLPFALKAHSNDYCLLVAACGQRGRENGSCQVRITRMQMEISPHTAHLTKLRMPFMGWVFGVTIISSSKCRNSCTDPRSHVDVTLRTGHSSPASSATNWDASFLVAAFPSLLLFLSSMGIPVPIFCLTYLKVLLPT